MSPKSLLSKWVEYFNNQDVDGLMSCYHNDAINHQTPNGKFIGKENIRKMFEEEFKHFTMICYVENIFEDGNWGMLEWKGDPEGSMRGCGFFHFQEEQIILQRGYWDQLSFMQQQNQIK
jgi:hypothetical protein